METIKKIMAALSFSDYDDAIFNYAVQLAKPFDAELIVASVINSKDVRAVNLITDMGYEVDADNYIKEITKERKAQIEKYQRQADFPIDRMKTVFKTGNPVDEILKICIREKVDLLVVGIKGRSDFETAFIGSVAEKLFRRSPVTVVSYRDPANAKRLKERIDLD